MFATIGTWFVEKAIFGRLRAFLAAHWRTVAMVVLIALLFLTAWRLIVAHDRGIWNQGYNVGWSEQHRALEDEQQSHAITRTSLNRALYAITGQNDAVQKLAAEGQARLAASDAAVKAAEVAARASEATAKALDASAGKTSAKDALCVPSETFLSHLGDL